MRLIRTHKYTRQYRKWPVVLPLYDGRECPDCHAPIVGGPARIAHMQDHEKRREEWEHVLNAVHKLCELAGVKVSEPASEEGPGGVLVGRAQEVADGDEDELPSRLGGIVIGNGYDDDEEYG